MHPFEWPGAPWYRVHINHTEIRGNISLVIIDTQSKHIDTHLLLSTSSYNAIEKLRQTLSTHGFPNIIASDNGTSFTSREFKQYNDIHSSIHSSPFHSQGNGLAGRAVQTIKSIWKVI